VDYRELLDGYLHPPLRDGERTVADDWILGDL
jgi:hypothetical protein